MLWIYGAIIYVFGTGLFFLFKHISEFGVIQEYEECRTRSASFFSVLNVIRNILGVILVGWLLGYIFAVVTVLGFLTLLLFGAFGFDAGL